MHYDWAQILASAEDLGEGWKKAVVVLKEGDSAHSPLSSKWDFQGAGEITYKIHPSGVDVSVGNGIRKSYK
ncbi:Minor tail protein [Nocardia ninae]